jgi:hypothetical protein
MSMAGPQFFTPKSVQPSRPRRHFTLQQATSSLPLVSRVVKDIVTTHGRATELQKALEQAPAKNQAQLQKDLDAAMVLLDDYVDELTEIGCDLKDYEQGLIDFTGRHHGRDVCLCWKLGEPTIGHWHETNAGAAGRQPIALLDETA